MSTEEEQVQSLGLTPEELAAIVSTVTRAVLSLRASGANHTAVESPTSLPLTHSAGSGSHGTGSGSRLPKLPPSQSSPSLPVSLGPASRDGEDTPDISASGASNKSKAPNLTPAEVLALVRAKRAEHGALSSVSGANNTQKMTSTSQRWAAITDAMAIEGCPRMEPNRMRKKWDNLMQTFRKINEHEKRSGASSFWELTTMRLRREAGMERVYMDKQVYDEMAEFVTDREGMHPTHVSDSHAIREERRMRRERGDDKIEGGGVGNEGLEEVGEVGDEGGSSRPAPCPQPHSSKKEEASPQADAAPMKKQRTAYVASSMEGLKDALSEDTIKFVTALDHSAAVMGTSMDRHADAVRECGAEMAAAIREASLALANSILSIGSHVSAANAGRHWESSPGAGSHGFAGTSGEGMWRDDSVQE